MFIQLSRSPGNEEVIREFRRDICQRIGMSPNGPGVHPLPHAFYLFARENRYSDPAGMIEFFFYDDAFADYSDSVYSQAGDLSQVAPMQEMIHVRSVIIDEAHRNSKMFLHLCAALMATAWDMGARFMTASTSTNYQYILGLHKNAGMKRLGVFTLDGAAQQLSFLELEPVASRAKRLTRHAVLQVDPGVLLQESFTRRMQVGTFTPIASRVATDTGSFACAN